MIQDFNEFTISNEENIIGGRRRKRKGAKRRRRGNRGGCAIETTPDVIEIEDPILIPVVDLPEVEIPVIELEEISTEIAVFDPIPDTY